MPLSIDLLPTLFVFTNGYIRSSIGSGSTVQPYGYYRSIFIIHGCLASISHTNTKRYIEREREKEESVRACAVCSTFTHHLKRHQKNTNGVPHSRACMTRKRGFLCIFVARLPSQICVLPFVPRSYTKRLRRSELNTHRK